MDRESLLGSSAAVEDLDSTIETALSHLDGRAIARLRKNVRDPDLDSGLAGIEQVLHDARTLSSVSSLPVDDQGPRREHARVRRLAALVDRVARVSDSAPGARWQPVHVLDVCRDGQGVLPRLWRRRVAIHIRGDAHVSAAARFAVENTLVYLLLQSGHRTVLLRGGALPGAGTVELRHGEVPDGLLRRAVGLFRQRSAPPSPEALVARALAKSFADEAGGVASIEHGAEVSSVWLTLPERRPWDGPCARGRPPRTVVRGQS